MSVVDGLRGVAAHLIRERRADVADLTDESLGAGPIRNAGRGHVDDMHVISSRDDDLGRTDAVERGDVVDEGVERRRVNARVGDDHIGSWVTPPNRASIVSQTCRDSDDLGKARTSRSSKRASRNGAARSTSTKLDRDDDEPGAAGDEPGESGEHPVVGCRRGWAQPVTETGEQRGEQRQRRGHAREDNDDAGDPDRPHRRVLEHEEARECDRDGRSRERDRTAAVAHCLVDRCIDVAPRTARFAEAADHQEAVVDAEPDPQHDHDVEGVHGHIHDGRDDTEREHRREDAAERRARAAVRLRASRRARRP